MVGVDVFHGLPVLASPGRRLPTASGYPKQQQQKNRSPCTTQESLPTAIAYCTPSTTGYPENVESFAPGKVSPSSQSPGRDLDGTQDGITSRSQLDPVSGEQHKGPQYGSEELPQRTRVMWPNQQLESENCDEYGEAQRLSPEMEAGGYSTSALPVSPPQDDDGYKPKASTQHVWQPGFQNPLHHPAWKPFHISNQARDHQPLYYPDRVGLASHTDDVHSSDIDPSSYAGTTPNLKSEAAESNYLTFVPTTSTYSSYHVGADAALTSTLSPCSNTLAPGYEVPRSMLQDREDNVKFAKWESEQEHGMSYKDELWCPVDSPLSIEAPGGKVDEPYAQLIYRALMSTPDKSMSLQEIYKWFRENTDKAKSEGKGWQNSIRHNLSMNGAFTKRNSKAAIRDPNDGSLTFDHPAADGRKATEWFLEPEFFSGVESTTRYRRGNSGSRSRQSGVGSSSSHARGSQHGGGGAYSDARVSAGRKGGNVAAQNRKRQAERQQQQHVRARAQMAAAMTLGERNNQHEHEHEHGLRFPGPVPIPYQGFADHEGAVQYYAVPTHHPTSSPFPHGFGGPVEGLDQTQGPAPRQLDINYFRPSDGDVNMEESNHHHHHHDNDNDNDKSNNDRPTTMSDEAPRPHPNEPVTPPESATDPPLQTDGVFADGKHYENIGGMMGLYHVDPMDPHQGHHHHHHLPGHGYGGGDQLHASPLDGYTLGSVAGIYEAPADGQQPPAFLDAADPEAVEQAVLFGIFDDAHH